MIQKDYEGLPVGCGIFAAFLFGVICIWFGWLLHSAHERDQVVIEKPAAEVRQSDGSLILERKPDAAASAPMAIPAGAKVERIAQVIVKPKPVPASAPDQFRDATQMEWDCPPVTVDLALIRQPDQTRRVIASSHDGVIVGGVDIPVEPALIIPDPPKWAAGADWKIGTKKFAPWVERDIGPVRVGTSIWESGGKPAGAARFGWRF